MKQTLQCNQQREGKTMFRKFLKDLIASEKKYLKRERLRCSEIIIEATCKSVKLVTMFLFLILSLDNKTKLFKS